MDLLENEIGDSSDLKKVSVLSEIKSRYIANPDAPRTDLLKVEKERLRTLSADDFEEYIRFCKNVDATETIAEVFDVIADRFAEDITKYSTLKTIDRYKAMDIGDTYRTAIWLVATDPQYAVPAESIQKIYNNINSEDRILAHHAFETVGNLMVLDNRNKEGETFVNIFQQYKDETLNALITPEDPKNIEKAMRLVDIAWADFPSTLPDFMIQGFDKAETTEARKQIWKVLSNRIGLGEARKKLRAYADVHEEFNEKLKKAEEVMGLEKVDKVYADIRDLYEQINFKDYKPNEQLQNEDTEFLYNEFKSKKRVLDIGAGTGRLMKSLKEKGLEVHGFDYVKSHAQIIKNEDPSSNISVASWENMPYRDEVFDAAYCLGRSILHNTTVEDMIKFFRESSRVLTKDGILIVDIPNADKGVYAVARDKIANAAQEMGIEHYEDGMVHDSPDGKNFFDRLAPSAAQFKAIAGLAGFEAEIIKEQNYNDIDGNENTNWYWKLKKLETKLDPEALINLMHEAYTSSAPITITWL